MNVLLVGSGGREHALAWKIAQSPRLHRLFIAPGNAGTAQHGQNIPLADTDIAGLVAFAQANEIDLVVVGPEQPLAHGLVDALQAVGIAAFGPSRAAAQLEANKAFAKDFFTRHNLPTAQYCTFSDYAAASAYLGQQTEPMVLKAAGLAAGKGVLLPQTPAEAQADLYDLMVVQRFGDAAQQVVIEERLSGPEVSLLAFCDGQTVAAMPPAQDHKRLLAGDQGPNTGGMGAFAPSPLCPPALVAELTQTILQPTITALAAEGMPYVGVLYAGLMLTPSGAKLLEFNCRFGDPETQVLLPLLKTDLLSVLLACVRGELADLQLEWQTGAAACVVLAAAGYPETPRKGDVIVGLADAVGTHSYPFQAGTRLANDGIIHTNGGRVLAATGWDTDLAGALQHAYASAAQIDFAGKQFRADIGGHARSL